ncbi:hypothetical protein J3R30DRAFT_3523872 [Lentinula aciculospora]|uniref:RING-type domain-containing protein n=1 Tax=Lentinula aciculospora TaxID=153920 RepID=A0A9W9A1F6_9AGAR|nr:hypothetical protein J3R30DRAFT_3523872 [Lentinula aciculospora]
MDTELKCNRLTCRKALTDKAVVTTCSHIFCVDCANELFNAARLCPACESSLSEPDDVVVCSLHPSNDYKTSVLSGLTPSIILEICSRAIAFWQYQIHQENSFQQAVLRNLNDKNSQLQKQLDNVIREANGEITLLNNKTTDLERDLEVERRKVRDLQEATREREKEYQKLKAQHDRIKRKALLGPNLTVNDHGPTNQISEDQRVGMRSFGTNVGNNVDFGAVVGGMEVNGIQRTPVVNRAGTFPNRIGTTDGWGQNASSALNQPQRTNRVGGTHRQPLGYAGGYVSDRSDSATEVENFLIGGGGGQRPVRVSTATGGWNSGPQANDQRIRPLQRAFAPPSSSTKRGSGTFRPAITR